MNYEAFSFGTPVWLAPVLWIVIVLSFALVISAVVSEKLSILRLVIGAIFMLAAGSILVVNAVLPDNWREAEAKKLSVYYGIEITGYDLRTLDYPLNAPTKLEYAGTTEISINGYYADAVNLTLAVDSEKAYLFTNGKNGYVELEPVEFTLQTKE